MKEWHIKEISELTQTSIRMLRHYDKIGLLKPSYRAANGYRCYTANDLAKLQQIIALKYFGFDLNTIKALLQKHQNVYAHLQTQQQVLKKQSMHLQQVNDAISDVLHRFSPSETPNWHDLITLIERYRMSENLREKLQKSWAGEILTANQFEEYLALYEKFPSEFAERDQLVQQINAKKLGDPKGPDGEHAANFLYEFAKKIKEYFSQTIKLSSSLMESIQSGKLNQTEFTPEGAMWIRQAMISFWLKRWDTLYDAILANTKSDPEGKIGKKIAFEWTGLIDDYFSIGTKSFLTGIMLWSELTRQDKEMHDLKTLPSLQEMVQKNSVKLLFNPEAVSWISRALEIHAK